MSQEIQEPSRWEKAKNWITKSPARQRNDEQWGMLKREAGLTPLSNQRDTETRRDEIVTILNELTQLEFQVLETKDKVTVKQLQHDMLLGGYKLARLFELFFATGSPWIRGRDNSILSNGVACFIQNFEEFGDIPDAFYDLHAEIMYLLHLSWQGLDVTNTPWYILQINNVPTPQARVDLSGSSQNVSKSAEKSTRKSVDV